MGAFFDIFAKWKKKRKKNMFLDDQFFEHFLSTEKNGENAKKGASLPSTGGVRRSRRARRGGKEGKPLRDRWETELGLTRQHPGGVRRI